MSEWNLYLLLELDTIRNILIYLGWGFILYLLILCLYLCIYLGDREIENSFSNNGKKEILSFKKIIRPYRPKLIIIISISLIIFGNLIPTTKQMTAIYVIPKITQNDNIQKIPDKLLNIFNNWLDELELKNAEKTPINDQKH